ncbi:hypothetical protein P8452_35642 [Trifolium repens]|nr:hypothetical protein P8452_35642 [Trifolium repens]
MEIGQDLSKTVSTFILQKILANEEGLDHICTTAERFFAVARVLKMVLRSLEEKYSPRLLKLVISCYSRLSNNHRASIALTSCLPNTLMDVTFINYICEDPTTLQWMETLLENIRSNHVLLEQGGGGVEN